MNRVDITSIMYNEEVLLPMWIEAWLAVPWINHIYLVDGGSTDRSVEIAKSYDRVSVIVVPWKNDFARQRNIAIKMAKSEWLIQPDIDEIPCGNANLDLSYVMDSPGVNQIALPYVKFYDWNKLWFFKDANTPNISYKHSGFSDGFVHLGEKSTLTIFQRSHLGGYYKSLHEMPFFNGVKVQANMAMGFPLETLGNLFLVGHYDQAKHFEQARRRGTSIELEMGLKRLRYRFISPATYDGKIYDLEWAKEAFEKYIGGDNSSVEELGAAQLKAFKDQHSILENYDAMPLNCEAVKKYVAK